MKKVIIVLAIMAVLLTGTAFAYTLPTVNGTHVNVRRAPKITAGVMYQLNSGNYGKIIEVHKNPGEEYPWYKFVSSEYDVNAGWIYGQYVNIYKSYISGSRVNMRQGPSKKAGVLYCFPRYEDVWVLGNATYYDGTWVYIYYKGKYGWVSAQYVQ